MKHSSATWSHILPLVALMGAPVLVHAASGHSLAITTARQHISGHIPHQCSSYEDGGQVSLSSSLQSSQATVIARGNLYSGASVESSPTLMPSPADLTTRTFSPLSPPDDDNDGIHLKEPVSQAELNQQAALAEEQASAFAPPQTDTPASPELSTQSADPLVALAAILACFPTKDADGYDPYATADGTGRFYTPYGELQRRLRGDLFYNPQTGELCSRGTVTTEPCELVKRLTAYATRHPEVAHQPSKPTLVTNAQKIRHEQYAMRIMAIQGEFRTVTDKPCRLNPYVCGLLKRVADTDLTQCTPHSQLRKELLADLRCLEKNGIVQASALQRYL